MLENFFEDCKLSLSDPREPVVEPDGPPARPYPPGEEEDDLAEDDTEEDEDETTEDA